MRPLPSTLAFEVCPESNYSLRYGDGEGAATAWRLTVQVHGEPFWRSQAVRMAVP